MAYTGSVELISGIKTKNGGTYPLADAKDIWVTDTKRLDAVLAELQAGGGSGGSGGVTYTVTDDILYITTATGQSITINGENMILP